MANVCDNSLIIKADWAKIAPFITKSDNYEKGNIPVGHYEQEGQNDPTVWNAEMNGLKIDWIEIMKVANEHDMGLRIFSTDDLTTFKYGDEEFVLVAFSSAWDFPVALETWLQATELPYQIAYVENGCEIAYVEGEDLGLTIFTEKDDDDTTVWNYIDYDDDLARALGRLA